MRRKCLPEPCGRDEVVSHDADISSTIFAAAEFEYDVELLIAGLAARA